MANNFMGLDTEIFFKAAPDYPDSAPNFPAGFTVKLLPAYKADEETSGQANFELDNGCRYYGEVYNRGPWPSICAALMILIQDPKVEKVWYGSDCGAVREIESADILILSLYYMKYGNRPYHGNTV